MKLLMLFDGRERLAEKGADLKGRSGDQGDGCSQPTAGPGSEDELNPAPSAGSTPASPARAGAAK